MHARIHTYISHNALLLKNTHAHTHARMHADTRMHACTHTRTICVFCIQKQVQREHHWVSGGVFEQIILALEVAALFQIFKILFSA